jgi:hypothetical protein
MPALSTATSAPVPMAMPTSAAASAGASLMPSPAMATLRPCLCNSSTSAFLSSGRTPGAHLVDAELSGDGLRGALIVAGRHDDAQPCVVQRLDRIAPSMALIGSATATMPAPCRRRRRTSPSCPRSARIGLFGSRVRIDAFGLPSSRRIAERDRLAADLALHALAGQRLEPVAEPGLTPRSSAPATMASASGCSEPAPARRCQASRSSSLRPAERTRRSKLRPALGQRAGLVDDEVSTFAMRSSASASLISTPACAPRPVAVMIDIGVARPSAQGHAMISTDTAETMAKTKRRLRARDQPGDEGAMIATATTAGTKYDATGRPAPGSARASAAPSDHLDDLREHRVLADLHRLHDERAVLVERAAGDIDRLPPWTPGSGSPVSMLSSTRNGPPSRHHRPGRLARAHAHQVAGDDVVQRRIVFVAIGVMRRAVFGARSISALIASPVRSRARSSSTWPTKTSAMMTTAASK